MDYSGRLTSSEPTAGRSPAGGVGEGRQEMSHAGLFEPAHFLPSVAHASGRAAAGLALRESGICVICVICG